MRLVVGRFGWMMEIKVWNTRKYGFSYHGWFLQVKEIGKIK